MLTADEIERRNRDAKNPYRPVLWLDNAACHASGAVVAGRTTLDVQARGA
jgi:hypothetical protein